MPKSVVGQSFDVVTCQNCDNALTFQKPKSSAAGEVELACAACGHIASYHQTHMRQAQEQYPL